MTSTPLSLIENNKNHVTQKLQKHSQNELANFSISELQELVTALATTFSDHIKKAKSHSDISAQFARIYQNPIIEEAYKRAEQSKEDKKKLIAAFQKGAAYIYEDSGFWEGATTKHYGYPGDFTLLECVYDRVPHTNTRSAVGALLDKWMTESVLAKAVAARKDTLNLYLNELAEQYIEQGTQAKVLSIASGSAREIREIPRRLLNGLDITLLDKDPKAMSYAREFFNTRAPAYQINTWEADALDPNLSEKISKKDQFDLVYSFGLYDYLNDEQLISSINIGKRMLKDNGTFIFCLKDHRFYDRWFYELLMSWRFYKRTIDDGYSICDRAGLKIREKFVVESRAVCIYVCEKI